jgi:hypothetical protein
MSSINCNGIRMNCFLAVSLVTTSMIIPTSIYGQDRCGDILTSGVHNTYQNISKTNAKSSYQQALCDQLNTSNSTGSSTNAGVSVLGYGDLTFGNANSTANTLYHKYCEGSNQEMSDDDFHSLVQITIDPTIVENWKECMASHGQGMYANVDVNGADLLFSVEWLGFGGVSTSKITNSPKITGAVCKEPPLVKGTVLQDQVLVTELCQRQGDDTVTFVVNTNRGSQSLKIPAPRKSTIAAAQRYRPADPSIPAAAAMNIEVSRRDLGGLYELAVSFTVPPAPPNAVNPYLTDLIKIWGGQRTFPSATVKYTPVAPIPLPPSTFPDVHGSWKTGDRVNFIVEVPKQFSDPSQGWIIGFCAGTNKGCFPSPNLLMGSPI